MYEEILEVIHNRLATKVVDAMDVIAITMTLTRSHIDIRRNLERIVLLLKQRSPATCAQHLNVNDDIRKNWQASSIAAVNKHHEGFRAHCIVE